MAERLTPSDVLELWESGRDADPLGRATRVWHVVSGVPVADLERLPVGRRDRALLESRIATFGSAAPSFVECPACSQELEFELDLRDLVIDPPGPDAGIHSLEHGDWTVEFRLPTIDDLARVAADGGGTTDLLDRCVVSVELAGEPQPIESATEIADALDVEMRRLDPQAELDLKLDCAACDHHWSVVFDIAHFYWRELELEASRVLGEVHLLASAYSWSESEILSLSPARRRAYLSRLGS